MATRASVESRFPWESASAQSRPNSILQKASFKSFAFLDAYNRSGVVSLPLAARIANAQNPLAMRAQTCVYEGLLLVLVSDTFHDHDLFCKGCEIA